MTPIIILGKGGHALASLDVIRTTKEFEVLGYVDSPGSAGREWEGIKFLGTDDQLAGLVKTCPNFFIGIGQIESSAIRKKIVQKLKELGAKFSAIVSPKAHVASGAKIGEGTIVMHGSHVGPGSKIGSFNILNTRSLIEHGSLTGDFVHVSTAAVVNGDVLIGYDSFIGSNSVLCHGIKVPEKAFVQAGEFIGRKHVW